MKMHQLLWLAGLAVIAGPLHADSCAGGFGRGMDITGNECNDPMPGADADGVARTPTSANMATQPARTVAGPAALVKTVAISQGAATAQGKGVATSRVPVKAHAMLAAGAGLENVAVPRAPVQRSAGVAP